MASGASAPQLDAIRAISYYIKTMLKPKEKEKEISGMKTLLLDKETVSACFIPTCVPCKCLIDDIQYLFPTCHLSFNYLSSFLQKTIVSMVFSMNEILSKQVFLIESLDAPHEGKMHMKVCRASCSAQPKHTVV